MDVLEFRDEFGFLSNFYPSKVTLDGVEYPTVEHAYQAAKTTDKKDRQRILDSSGPGGAKRIGQTVVMRADWEEIKISIMANLVSQKFEKLKGLRRKLLAIDGQIVEGNHWHDTFWGVCKGKGRNELGKILMQIRDTYLNA